MRQSLILRKKNVTRENFKKFDEQKKDFLLKWLINASSNFNPNLKFNEESSGKFEAFSDSERKKKDKNLRLSNKNIKLRVNQ